MLPLRILCIDSCVCVCERVSVFPGLHAVKCRIVSHRRISHQQAAVVLARSCVQANYNHSQRLSAYRGKVFNCCALTGALQFSVEFLMDKYGRAIHAQHSSLSSTVHTIITKSKLKTLTVCVCANPFSMVFFSR